MINKNPEQCIHCHKCTEHCDFLNKYKMDIGDVEKLKAHAFNCFLCGTCSQVCPVGIDGKEVILGMRQQIASEDSRIIEKQNKGLLWEKNDYKFKNYRHAKGNSALFPGCNFPSLYPKTTKKIAEIFREQYGIGIVYDCCGKPVSELGLLEKEKALIDNLEKRLSEQNIKELILFCPNCYGFFKDKLSVSLVPIYEKIEQLGIGKANLNKDGKIFLPCSDRYEREWYEQILKFSDGKLSPIEGVQCCGLGGCASGKEPEIVQGLAETIRLQTDGVLYTYCASCSGQLTRQDLKSVKHVLPEIFETSEKPEVKKSFINRAVNKFR